MPLPSFHHPVITKAYKQFSPVIKSKKTASYFTITLSLFSLSFFGLFAIRPTLITATTLIKNVVDLKKLNLDYENKISSIIRAQSEYEQIRYDLPLIDKALPSSSQFNKLAVSVEKFAKQENINLIQFQIDPVPISKPKISNKLQSFDFSLNGNGTYSSVSLFLQHLLNWQRLATINTLEMSKEGNAAEELIRITIKGTLYYES